MSRRIGLFGGTFNPVHFGHVRLARQLQQLYSLDEVWMMVSPQNPFKRNHALQPDETRLEMVRLALKHEKHIVACDYEFHLARPSYTWNTLQSLKNDYPDCSFTLLIGADNWESFHNWYHHEDILKMCQIVIYPRKGSPVDTTKLPSNVKLADTKNINISSTNIRQRISQGMDIRRLVPKAVESYIMERQLYKEQ